MTEENSIDEVTKAKELLKAEELKKDQEFKEKVESLMKEYNRWFQTNITITRL